MPLSLLSTTLRRLEGRHVAVALRDGTRLPDCELVSAAGARSAGTLWLVVGDDDRMVPVDDITELVALA